MHMIKLQLFCPINVIGRVFADPVRSRIVHPAAGRLIEACSSDRQTPVGRKNYFYVTFRTHVFNCILLLSGAAPFIRHVRVQLAKLAAKLTTG